MFESKNDKEALKTAMDEYVRDHAPVSCDDLVRAMEEQGFHCYLNMARKYLKDSGFSARKISGRWLWDTYEDDQDDQSEETQTKPTKSQNDRKAQERQETNERMTQERDALWDAVQKSVSLKNEIKSAQERLLMEIAGLIQATYGQSPVASVPSPRESETKSEAD